MSTSNINPASETSTDDSGFTSEDLLVEEVSIDGMCGVY
ncbi:mycofactocin precursor MftA [Hoyosella altamirensis]|uniref:Mycofactocin n=1 Tax=Hoyosella altamirensis TaxID=616997 RepID=A0A839RR83_9ACTN|nr:mycofactocin precursor MftA [Hoyosella altamirensis]MBB3038381.1 mycofactocin precursor [Hoyosella altamirensis]